MTRRLFTAVWVMIVSSAALAGCATTQTTQEPSLYERLGGRHAIRLVVDDFVTNAAKNPQIASRFKGLQAAQVEKLKSNLADFICDATGGPCSYVGRDMKTAHTGMKITEAEWTAFSESLIAALDKNKVDSREKGELLGVVAAQMKDIVGQ